jgi:hypothetical protein
MATTKFSYLWTIFVAFFATQSKLKFFAERYFDLLVDIDKGIYMNGDDDDD